MPITPAFLAARAAERRLRDLAHLRALCWLPLSCRGVVLTRTPLVPFTQRHRLELRCAGNAFFAPGPILLGDVFLVLWRLHPLHRAPLAGRAGAIARLGTRHLRLPRLWYALGSLRAACIHRRLTRAVRAADLAASIAAINAFLATTHQDAGCEGAPVDAPHRVSPAAADRHLPDNHLDWLMTRYRMTYAEALDLPFAIAHQLYRERVFQSPDGELAVFAPSDALLSARPPALNAQLSTLNSA